MAHIGGDEMSEQPKQIDLSSPTANMFGVQPCPRCKSQYRYPLKEPKVIRCDDCKLDEPVKDGD